jgi:hypothetical protein
VIMTLPADAEFFNFFPGEIEDAAILQIAFLSLVQNDRPRSHSSAVRIWHKAFLSAWKYASNSKETGFLWVLVQYWMKGSNTNVTVHSNTGELRNCFKFNYTTEYFTTGIIRTHRLQQWPWQKDNTSHRIGKIPSITQ